MSIAKELLDRLDLDVYPFLPRTNIATTSAASYMSLLAGGGA